MTKKKLLLMLFAGVFVAVSLAGCGNKTTDANENTKQQEEESSAVESTKYEWIMRELPEAKYIEAAEVFVGGSGTASDPYQISSAREFALMEKLIREENVIEDGTNYYEACYILTKDIELNDTSNFENWADEAPEYSWRPIAGNGEGHYAKCSFDGAGHTISGLYINVNNENYYDAYGLFGLLSDASVKNVVLDKSYICVSGQETSVGGIVGNTIGECEITDCRSNAVIDVYDGTVGGVVGSLSGGRSGTDEVEYTEEDDKRGLFSVIKNCSFGGTIRQVRENSMSYIGGIVGNSDGDVTGCTNKGTIQFDALSVDAVGGIAARMSSGIISDCENAGNIDCTLAPGTEASETVVRAGGIVGSQFMSATGSRKYMARVSTVKNCHNNGSVSGTEWVGGIVGAAENDRNDWCLAIADCVNSAPVISLTDSNVGGIAGQISCLGDPDYGNNVVVENCRNEADLSRGTVGGIAGSLMTRSGDVLLRNCTNSGNLSAGENAQYAGGIIASWLFDAYDKSAVHVTVENCKNEGNVSSSIYAGGIFAYADCPVKNEGNELSELIVKDCANSGAILAQEVNGYIGGIAGCWGMDSVKSSFENCVNSGAIVLDNKKPAGEELDEMEEDGFFTLARICGGIAGKVGPGLYLGIDNDKPDAENINKENAQFTFKNCISTGALRVNDAEEYKDKNGKFKYRNFFGGIIGNACAENSFSVLVEDCSYSGFERGLGNEELPDVGIKK